MPAGCRCQAPVDEAGWQSCVGTGYILEPRRAISYGPVPLKTQGAGIAQDDWMVQAAKPMWGKRGRDVPWL